MPLIASLTLLVSCAVLWSPTWPGALAGNGVLALVLLLLRMLAGRGGMLVALPLASLLVTAEQQLADQLPASAHGRDVLVVGRVCEFPWSSPGRTRLLLRGRLPDAPDREVLLEVSDYRRDADWQAGDRWQLKLRLRSPRGFRNPGAPDRERRLFASGIAARAYVRPSLLNQRLDGGDRGCPGMSLRAALARELETTLGPRPALPYLLALTVGARHRLETDDWRRLRATGTVHLMAISGLHVGLVAGLGFLLGRLLGARLRAGAGHLPWIMALTLAATYTGLAGFAIPTLRALLMLGVAAVALAGRRRLPAWSALAAALWLVLLCQPLAPLQAGFWLSFGAVAILLLPALRLSAAAGPAPGRPAWRWLRAFLATQLRISVGLLALSAWFFSAWPPLAPLANLLAIPLVGMLGVPLALAGLLMPLLGLPGWGLEAAATVIELCLKWLDWLQATPLGRPLPLSLTPWVVPAALLSSLLCLWPRPVPARSALLAVAVLGCLAGSLRGWRPLLDVLVLDVGQGQAVLVQTRSRALLYDAGPAWPGGDAVDSVLLPVLRRARVRRLEVLMISHGDRDHAGGLRSLAAKLPPGRLLAPVGQLPPAAAALPCRAGDRWHWDGVDFEILHPVRGSRLGGDNDRSCVLLVSTGESAVLLTGDISRRGERELLRRAALPAIDLLLVPHHGSRSSSGPEIVAASRPRYAVASTGWRNRWGFPDAAVQARWRRSGACFLTTADWGALRFRADEGQRLRLVRAERLASRHWWNRPPPSRRPCAGDVARL